VAVEADLERKQREALELAQTMSQQQESMSQAMATRERSISEREKHATDIGRKAKAEMVAALRAQEDSRTVDVELSARAQGLSARESELSERLSVAAKEREQSTLELSRISMQVRALARDRLPLCAQPC
jgi:hypothetical protein